MHEQERTGTTQDLGAIRMIAPLTLKYLHFGICQVAADDVGDSTSVVIQLKVTPMLRHDLLEILQCQMIALSATPACSATAEGSWVCFMLTACEGVVKPLTMMLTPLNKSDMAWPLAAP